ARLTPGGPEVDEHRVTLEVLQLDVLPVEAANREWRRLTDGICGNDAEGNAREHERGQRQESGAKGDGTHGMGSSVGAPLNRSRMTVAARACSDTSGRSDLQSFYVERR